MSDRIIPFDSQRRRESGHAEAVSAPRRRPPVPRVPDFARADATWLQARDIAFLLEAEGHAPADGGLITEGIPPALEALLERDGVVARVAGDTGGWLDISPHLYFHVMLRRLLPTPRTYLQRRVLRYLANLLSLFVRTDRLYRIQPGEAESFEYLVDLLAEAAESEHERQFLVHAHLGNYALYLAGLGRRWIEHRLKYGRSALGLDYYQGMGRRAYRQAADHRLARELELQPVFAYLAQQFDHYADALLRLGAARGPHMAD
ncbi:hypothetical protein [Salinisphaera sp. LB1]|uniref:hypothetical protein n=1 Tax=Salinisphaera sp. LB1 TaxID=2183911 RepID=UPI000D7071D7|nr:hypothetical protein [Salinisphaera sp. LB1]AWN17869.1 hypothetical protein SALB1_3677 [Salinisphaera sp. LB1]